VSWSLCGQSTKNLGNVEYGVRHLPCNKSVGFVDSKIGRSKLRGVPDVFTFDLHVCREPIRRLWLQSRCYLWLSTTISEICNSSQCFHHTLPPYHPCSRGASYYGRRSRGCWFPPIILQETKSLVSRSFTLWRKSKGRRNLKWLFWKRATDSQRKFGSGGNGNPNYGQEVVFLLIKISIIDKIYALPKAPIPIFDCIG
jgi:hypothetical protein